ncbi:MAG: o-succinylbenzoate synthase [Sediminibacterium sp.]
MRWRYIHRILQFTKPAKTSRDTLFTRDSWILQLVDFGGIVLGEGEVAPLWGLSKETKEDVLSELDRLTHLENSDEVSSPVSSVQCAIDAAVAGYHSEKRDFPFLPKNELNAIPINGLIWMNEIEAMRIEAKRKFDEGSRCIKLKIGALNFNSELNLIREIRSWGSEDELTIRVDANGAFRTEEALDKLQQLSEFKLHSIEQPIRAGQLDTMFKLCSESPVPIAFDEELIGSDAEDFESFLHLGKPAYLVVKPSLHGGYSAAENWKVWADKHGIGYWITSSLESNVGLNHLANWVCKMKLEGVQGLGTGSLFSNNSEAKWKVEGELLIPIEA